MKISGFIKNRLLLIILTAAVVLAVIPVYFYSIKSAGNKTVSGDQIDTEEMYIHVFVGGAVVNEGWFELEPDTVSYAELFEMAEVTAEIAVLTKYNLTATVNMEDSQQKGGVYYMVILVESIIGPKLIDLNNCLLSDLSVRLSLESAENIMRYLSETGRITDKEELLNNEIITSQEYNKIKYCIYAIEDKFGVLS